MSSSTSAMIMSSPASCVGTKFLELSGMEGTRGSDVSSGPETSFDFDSSFGSSVVCAS